MTKHTGIVSVSHEGAALCYRSICAEALRGCNGVGMGCTEIPLILKPDDVRMLLLDSTRLLAKAALEEALGGP